MNKEDKETLRLFQCDYNRGLEEMFAQTLSENEAVRLFFINENEAFTDGKNIVVDPALDGLFADKQALTNTEKYMKLPDVFSTDSWYALRMVTRAQNIHECLHLLYTDFPTHALSDSRCDTKAKLTTMALISNIIEDAYIEAAGCSVFDNLELYLRFGRVSRLFANTPSDGTANRAFEKDLDGETKKVIPLVTYLNYMAVFLLYPMVAQDTPPEEIADYVSQSKPLFLRGSAAPSPDERYVFCQKIFDIIMPLIPEDDKLIDTSGLSARLGGLKTHSPNESTIGNVPTKGKSQVVSERLFTDLDGNAKDEKNLTAQVIAASEDFEKHKQSAIAVMTYEGQHLIFTGSDYDCPVLHKNIKINEIKPKINLNLRKAYQNIYNRYRININSYNSRFVQLLRAQVPMREDKHLFGTGINSKQLGDLKKRYWYRNVQGIDVPDIAVLLLIDGSGSMSGVRRDSAMISAVILHEVLKKQGVFHAVVEHRAGGSKPEIDINILVGFNAREEEKYNLMQISAYGDNRDGLALFWTERYLNEQTRSENKLIIVLSDGVPVHMADDYYPPVSTKDTANAVKKIVKKGTDIIAVALDNEGSFECYDTLKEIYPNIVSCNDLKRLTGQILTLVSKRLR